MSTASVTEPPSRHRRETSRSRRFVPALICLLLAALSLIIHRGDVRTNREAAELLRESGELVILERDLRLTGAGDSSLALAADAALAAGASPAARDRAAGAPTRGRSRARGETARAARDLMLRAVEARPGSARHRLLLGRSAYAVSAAEEGQATGRPATWAAPLQLAAAGAPGLDVAWTELALAYLTRWQELSSGEREGGVKAVRRAAVNDEFVASGYVRMISALGRDQAAALLADEPRLLDIAAEVLIHQEDLRGAANLLARRDRVQRTRCAAERVRMDRSASEGDAEGVRAACTRWASAGCAGDLRFPADQRAAARLLELWPEKPPGDWESDPRSQIVLRFLDAGEPGAVGTVLLRTVDRLGRVPDPIRAQVLLLAGDLNAAERMADRPEALTALEWTPYLVALARHHLRQGRVDDANAALERVGLGFRDACEVLLVRRQVARAQGNRFEVAALDERLGGLADGLQPRQTQGEARFSLCVDPVRLARTALVLRLTALRPAIVAYGWDGSRPQTIHVRTDQVLRIPLGGLAGRQGLSLRFVAGGPVRVLQTSLEQAG